MVESDRSVVEIKNCTQDVVVDKLIKVLWLCSTREVLICAP